jgi:hypothetical protein
MWWVIEPPNHVHALWDSDFIPQSGLSEIWATVTGDSFIVDIRPVSRYKKGAVARYLTKYLTKTINIITGTEFTKLLSRQDIGGYKDPIKEQYNFLTGLHLIGSWNVLLPYHKLGLVCDNCQSTSFVINFVGVENIYNDDGGYG